MMFIIRCHAGTPLPAEVQVKASRQTPEVVRNSAGKTDYFCVGKAEAIAALRAEGWDVVELRDGWYADDAGGGVGISGHGRYWEVRDTPLTVKESVRPADAPTAVDGGEEVNVRSAIFGV
jgi:hypothetical protein